jgi:hypothetical protein
MKMIRETDRQGQRERVSWLLLDVCFFLHNCMDMESVVFICPTFWVQGAMDFGGWKLSVSITLKRF